MRIRIGSFCILVVLASVALLPLFPFPAPSVQTPLHAPRVRPAPGSAAIDAAPWTFNGAATLTVTDAFNRGDRFNVLDNGNPVGTTPAAGSSGTCGSDPNVCLADPLVSHAAFSLGPGAHSITITVAATVGAGAGYLRVTATPAIPALSQPALAGLAFLLAALASWFLFRPETPR
jgi:hypothetical protein